MAPVGFGPAFAGSFGAAGSAFAGSYGAAGSAFAKPAPVSKAVSRNLPHVCSSNLDERVLEACPP